MQHTCNKTHISALKVIATGDRRISPGATTPTTSDEHESTASTQCEICMAAPRESAFVPCGHGHFCDACASRIAGQQGAICPICRTQITDILRVFV